MTVGPDKINSPVVVVTGGGRGIGRAISERLLQRDDHVVVLDLAEQPPDWVADHDRVSYVGGDAGSDEICRRAVEEATERGTLVGWVNNAAVFRDVWLHEAGGAAVADLIRLNLQPALAGSAAAVADFRRTGTAGCIVNVSSHQAQRPVRGALPYATAKAAVEGLTRALAVDYGPDGIRVNAVALGSIVTERLEQLSSEQLDAERAMAELHPLGRAGASSEVADVVTYLLSEQASFISGAIVPVDGARSVNGPDPESR